MNTPAEILTAFAERGFLIHLADDAGTLAITECDGAKLAAADAATLREHKLALLVHLARERRAFAWYDAQPKAYRAAIAHAAAATLRATAATDAPEVLLVAIEQAARATARAKGAA